MPNVDFGNHTVTINGRIISEKGVYYNFLLLRRKYTMSKIVDLSLELHEGMLTYPAPWHPVVEVTQLGRFCQEGRMVNKVTLGTHTGTHIDAPLHFIENGLTIDKVDLNVLVGPAKVLDMTHKSSYAKITVEDIKKTNVIIEKGDRIIVKTGWDKNWMTRKYYKEYPCITEEAAQWLVDKGVVLMVLDTPSPDDPKPEDTSVDSPVHKIFLSNNVILCEYTTNLTELSDKAFLCALPLKFKNGDAFSARVIAIID